MATTAQLDLPPGLRVLGPLAPRFDMVLTHDALAFVADLHREFEARRQDVLTARRRRQAEWDAGALPGFLHATRRIRDDDSWRIAAIPDRLLDRRVEITGPVDRKMMINALNSGARVFMADFEDSNSPTWHNNVQGQVNLRDHARGALRFRDPTSGKEYAVGDDPATLVTRVRGWHLDEAHVVVDSQRMSASLFDFGLHFFHNHAALARVGLGPWYYLPKMEHHLEARLWNDVFLWAQDALGVAPQTIKVTCLIETFPAVFQMDEILYELRDHVAGLNAGRWDYIFSCIKTMRNHKDKVLPDRGQVTMSVPFMRAYTELLVATCHKRGAFAMGGMSAFIPNRRDEAVTANALKQVRADKQREAADGCDGTWVAHPDLVPVATEIFDAALGARTNQLDKQRPDVQANEATLRDFSVPGGQVTDAGLRLNVDVALQYVEAWLRGTGAVAIHDLMEDAATAEISRSQIWQWLHTGTNTTDGALVTRRRVRQIIDDVRDGLVQARGDAEHRFGEAAELLATVALADEAPEFLTLPAYEILIKDTRRDSK
jgi:malate synthase